MRKSRRFLFLLALAGSGVACGLGLSGSLEAPPVDAGADTSLGPSLPEAGGWDGFAPDALADGALDASLDVNPANCEAGCDGGVCDGGWCTFPSCATTAGCTGAPVVCPPGIPCAVTCSGTGACNKGVDCSQASACVVDCSGTGACQGGPMPCTGIFCATTCSGAGSCNQAVTCDAGSCALVCSGTGACQGAPVACAAGSSCSIACTGAGNCNKGATCDAGACSIVCTGDKTCQGGPVSCNGSTCAIQCGLGDAGTQKDQCNAGVSCTTTTSCKIACLDQGTCGAVSAVSAGTVDVGCDASACSKVGISAGDAGVRCVGNNACQNGVTCDGGACATSCNGTSASSCCKASSCSNSGCAVVTNCP